MSDTSNRSRALEEASRWFTELKRPAITAKALQDFRAWRGIPENATAFAKVERAWEAAGALRNRPAIVAATAEALAARPARPVAAAGPANLRPWILGLAILALLGAGGALFAVNQSYPTYSTSIGGQRLEILADGSRVRLNTNSKIRVHLTRGERHIKLLRGEAFFEVAHDASRPFTVESDGAKVRALGTKFDVRRDSAAVRVTLLEGRVEVRQTGRPEAVTLAPDQALTVTTAGVSVPQVADAADASSWTTGRLTFRGLPLKAAIQEINRYSLKKIVLAADSPVANEPVSGQFETGDTASFVKAVEAVFGLQASDSGREIHLTRAPSAE
jgi:transmembrane sensor